jgi:hypothetical protein
MERRAGTGQPEIFSFPEEDLRDNVTLILLGVHRWTYICTLLMSLLSGV